MAALQGMSMYAARLESFAKTQPASKRRASSTKSAKNAKNPQWPHISPSPHQLAQAGFYYDPLPSHPDNTTCYSCKTCLDGWEPNDNPVVEHLTYSPDCGIAIHAKIEQDTENGTRDDENPMSEKMIEARKATFADLWPHEKKRGWTCKVNKMVDAGWYYAPIPDSDDAVRCAYCSLSLDGWEPKDDPWDEHQRRSADCAFFSLVGPLKSKSTKSKKGRASKTSRLSAQSVATLTADDLVFDGKPQEADSMLTVADTIILPTTSKAKKSIRATKGRVSKGPRASTQPVVPAAEDVSMLDANIHEAESVLATANETASVSNTTKGRKPTRSTKGRASKASRASAQTTTATATSAPEPDCNVDEGESLATTMADTTTLSSISTAKAKRPSRAKKGKGKTQSKVVKAQAQEVVPASSFLEPEDDDFDVKVAESSRGAARGKKRDSDEMENSNEVVEEAVPKKRTKRVASSTASTRRGNNKSKTSIHEGSVITGESKDDMEDTVEEEAPREVEVDTVIEAPKRATRGKKRNSDEMDDGSAPAEAPAPAAKRNKRTSVASHISESHSREEDEALIASKVDEETHREEPSAVANEERPEKADAQKKVGRQPKQNRKAKTVAAKKNVRQASEVLTKQIEEEIVIAEDQLDDQEGENMTHVQQEMEAEVVAAVAQEPSGKNSTPTKKTQMQIPSPTPSPQSSDAENQPPSSRPSQTRPPLAEISLQTTYVPLADDSPSRLKTGFRWSAVGLEDVFGGIPSRKVFNGGLSASEQKMTVEEWIMHNAVREEEKLRAECERMVSRFENEGVRALKALEGIFVS